MRARVCPRLKPCSPTAGGAPRLVATGFRQGLPPSQISGGPVDFDHVAVGVVAVEGEGHTVVEYGLNRDILLHNSRVEGSELGE